MHPRQYMLFRNRATFDAPNDQGGGAANDPPAGSEVSDDPPAQDPVNEPPAGNQPTDAEARLLKDVMKQKKAAQDAKAALDAANARLAAFDGIDPEKVRKLIADQQAAEQAEAEKRGEYDRILARMREENDAVAAAQAAKQAEAEAKLSEAQRRIDDLTIGQSFAGSKFLAENTLLPPSKARRLYGDHFEFVDGELVAYDKPKGSKERTPLVDARGENLPFEAAIEKIVKADPDFETIGRAKIRPGSGSVPSNGGPTDDNKNKAGLSGRELIAANLGKLKKSK